MMKISSVFPSPHSGILFLSGRIASNPFKFPLFPSPHSGILFLLLGNDTKQYVRGTRFRPLIRGFFFYFRDT